MSTLAIDTPQHEDIHAPVQCTTGRPSTGKRRGRAGYDVAFADASWRNGRAVVAFYRSRMDFGVRMLEVSTSTLAEAEAIAFAAEHLEGPVRIRTDSLSSISQLRAAPGSATWRRVARHYPRLMEIRELLEAKRCVLRYSRGHGAGREVQIAFCDILARGVLKNGDFRTGATLLAGDGLPVLGARTNLPSAAGGPLLAAFATQRV